MAGCNSAIPATSVFPWQKTSVRFLAAAFSLLFSSSTLCFAGAAPGPDAFGYTVVRTTNFSFVQITNGTGIRVLAFNDDATTNVNIGFTFNFYGTNYSSVSFNVNGLLSFVAPSMEYANVDLTTTSPTNNQPTIAVLWDDWETQEIWADAIYYKTTGTAPFRQFILQWNKVVPVNGDGTNTVTFEAILFETSNRILCSYLDATVSDETTNAASLGAGATVGIRDKNGQSNNRNLQWSYNQAVITNGLNLLFSLANHAPVASNDTVTTFEDSPVTIPVLANDSDADGDSLALTAVTQGSNGTVTQNSSTTVKYSPSANFFGTDSFTYTIRDAAGGSATGIVSVTLTPVNDPPTLDPLTNVSVNEDAGLRVINLTGISSGAANESDSLLLTATSSVPSLITVSAITYTSPNSTGTVSFVAVTNGFGTATITVTANDGRGSNNIISRSFTVTVDPVNDPPNLDPIGDITLNEDAGVQNVTITGANQGAPNEADVLTLAASSSNPELIPNPTVTYSFVSGFGTVSFTPVTNGFGTATLTVTVSDGQPSNNIINRSFSVTVNSVNDPPTLDPLGDLSISEDAGLQTINLTGITSGATNENDTLTLAATSSNTNLVPTPAIVYTNPNSTGTLFFASATNAFGAATITVTLNDGKGSNNIVTRSFTVTVSQVNHAPLPGADSLDTYANTTLTVSNALLLANDTDPDPGDIISLLGVYATNTSGTVTQGSGTVIYQPPSNFTGADAFTYTITDNHGAAATGAVSVTIWPLPLITSIEYQTNGHALLSFSGIPGRPYAVQASVNLLDWTNAGTASETNSGQFRFDDAGATAWHFYRVRSF